MDREPGSGGFRLIVFKWEQSKKPGNQLPGFSAETQNRTVDTTIFSRMLYQLSYLGEPIVFQQRVIF